MISKESVQFKDAVMRVTRHDGTFAADGPSATIQVSNIPDSFKQDTLSMLFENTKRSGGGNIEKIDFAPDTGRALITFQDSAGLCLNKFWLFLLCAHSKWFIWCHATCSSVLSHGCILCAIKKTVS